MTPKQKQTEISLHKLHAESQTTEARKRNLAAPLSDAEKAFLRKTAPGSRQQRPAKTASH